MFNRVTDRILMLATPPNVLRLRARDAEPL